MISCCQIPKEKLEKDPKKYLKSHMMVCMLEGNTVVCSVAEKKNNTGIMYNERFLLLNGHSYIGYFNTIPSGQVLPFKSLIDVPKMKHEVPLKDINSWKLQDRVLTIKYETEVDKKKQNHEWVFKFDTYDLSKDWKHHMKRAEQARKDSERRQYQNSNRPQSIVGIDKELKEGRGIVGTFPSTNSDHLVGTAQPATQPPEVKENDKVRAPSVPKQTNTNSFHEKLEKVSSIQKFQKPSSQIESNPLIYEDNPQSDRIIDKTHAHSSHSKPKTPSPRSVRESPMNHSKFSPIDNIHAKSPSLNSSIRQSPSSPASPHPSTIHKQSGSSKPVEQRSVVPKLNYREQSSPRWKQPVVSNKKWNYRIQHQNVPFVLYEFKLFSEAVTKQVIDNLSIGNPEVKLRRKSDLQLVIDYQGLTLLLCFCGKRSVKVDDTTVKEDAIEGTIKEFNNLEYVFSSLQNKTQPFVALASVIFYKGILVYLFCNVPSSSAPASVTFQQSERITQKTRITTVWRPYQIVQSLQFNNPYLVSLKSYLPTLNSVQLARNFVQLPDFQSQKFPSGELGSTLSKADKRIEYLNKVMLEHLKYSTGCLDNFKQYITNSQQFQQFLVSYGINEMQLGELYSLSKNPYIRRMIGFQCIFRVAKTILFKELQMNLTTSTDMSANLIIDKNILLLNSNKALIQITVDFLNSMVGKSKNAEVIWEIVNNELGDKFGIYNAELAFNDGYYLQGLVYHFNVDINWNLIKTRKSFDPQFSHSSINQFLTNSRVYNCDYHLEFKGISKLLQTKTEQSYKILLQSLDLYKSPIPEHYKLSNLYDRIKVFISLFLSPTEEQQRFKHLNIYSDIYLQPPTSTSIQIQISTFKWALKQHNKEKSLAIFDELTSHITQWLGPYHPFLLEIYNLLSSYYQSIEEYQQAVTLAKSSVVNSLKMFGGNSLQLAEAYVFLADVYASMHKHDESLINEKKAKAIYNSNKHTDNMDYIFLLLRISRLLLHFGKASEAIDDVIACLEYFDGHYAKQEYLVSAYEIAARCYEVTKNTPQYNQLVKRVATKLINILDPLNLEKMLKITVFYSIKELKKETKTILKQIIQRLPRAISEQSYIQGYQYIRNSLKQDRFDLFVQNTLNNAKPFQSLDNTIQSRGKYNENERAIGLMEALRNFLGSTFITKLLS